MSILFGSSMEHYLFGVSKITIMVICIKFSFRNFQEHSLERIQRFHISFANATLLFFLRNLQVQVSNKIQTQIVEGVNH